ncbi:chemotaxis protein CheW [Aquisalimonas asiatica]|uniref:Twitching motility protein PilI n=1 Tax=Aquisalimonas asiatica TaxID=406100 RepID=A0A1H8TQ73_9GAMM|nr:chemotaxis protein CheW [Aquisalimonas asiatica]SEO93037.1 twitching motility protein PilI [Aquisalimonas asiatica]
MTGTAFELLTDLERLGRDHAADLPAQEEHSEDWVGVGFRLGGQRFASPMAEVAELLKYPELAPVPRTRPWVRGMANVRGTLLPIMDLNGFMGEHNSSLTRLSRVLVIPIENAYTGLLVDEVFGLRHFPREALDGVPEDVPGSCAPFVTGSVTHHGERWLLFSMRALVDDPQFLMVAS